MIKDLFFQSFQQFSIQRYLQCNLDADTILELKWHIFIQKKLSLGSFQNKIPIGVLWTVHTGSYFLKNNFTLTVSINRYASTLAIVINPHILWDMNMSHREEALTHRMSPALTVRVIIEHSHVCRVTWGHFHMI